ncbi:MAG: YbhB/YbcL family Raf kinase inhibitor-like protein [Candidatus Levybacteria bacterium]|nr:YbhB/YbcL family Raf kinase inhibitor-like protein [Candidatus Levybacteria bacterium]MBI3069987.1 YbhB/YbcL family Raf kinase inhibitor-like protein [Candidatus Levybacteria bacterium]MBI3093140.1 YbhB/YbcL family Raf kinase inhibitor-like protein [Candidatus Levybacteria bacterium]
MKILSSAFLNNQQIPSIYTCDGENVSPPLSFSEVPKNAKSLVLIVDDPDAPAKIWVHWVVFNIDPAISEVLQNSVPKAGVEGMTDFGKPGYGGPCPPAGTHRYFFKLYALDTVFNLPQNSDKKAVEEAMKGHILDSAELIGLYKRQGDRPA